MEREHNRDAISTGTRGQHWNIRCFVLVILWSSAVPMAVGINARASAEVYLVPGSFHGLSNQRMCIGNAIAIALKKQWKLVLPDIRFNYPNISDLFAEPFQFFFDIQALDIFVSEGLNIATTLPISKQKACMIQLQHSLQDAIQPSPHVMDSWAYRHGVVCLHDRMTIDNPWSQQYMTDRLKGQIRKALRPSLQFQEELQQVSSRLETIVGTPHFLALHARIEDDWREYCDNDLFKGEVCYVGEEGLLSFLQENIALERHSPIYIASGANVKYLPRLCGIYKCFTRDDIWYSSTSLVRHANEFVVKAYIDFLIAQKAYMFIGNRHSTFSMELYHLFRDAGKRALFINELQCTPRQKVAYFGCQPVNLLACCVPIDNKRKWMDQI